MRGNQRILLIVGAIAVVVVAFIIISPGGDDDKASTTSATTTTTTTAPAGTTSSGESTTPATTTAAPDNVTNATVRIVDAKPQGGIKTVTTKKNDTVNLTVVSDTADEIHVHGYDLMKDVAAGGRVTISFKATIVGIFEAELEGRGEQIVKLVVEQ